MLWYPQLCGRGTAHPGKIRLCAAEVRVGGGWRARSLRSSPPGPPGELGFMDCDRHDPAGITAPGCARGHGGCLPRCEPVPVRCPPGEGVPEHPLLAAGWPPPGGAGRGGGGGQPGAPPRQGSPAGRGGGEWAGARSPLPPPLGLREEEEEERLRAGLWAPHPGGQRGGRERGTPGHRTVRNCAAARGHSCSLWHVAGNFFPAVLFAERYVAPGAVGGGGRRAPAGWRRARPGSGAPAGRPGLPAVRLSRARDSARSAQGARPLGSGCASRGWRSARCGRRRRAGAARPGAIAEPPLGRAPRVARAEAPHRRAQHPRPGLAAALPRAVPCVSTSRDYSAEIQRCFKKRILPSGNAVLSVTQWLGINKIGWGGGNRETSVSRRRCPED